nr:MAG TPA: hypothetical protein [Caudoviricetes sp.]
MLSARSSGSSLRFLVYSNLTYMSIWNMQKVW